MADARDVRRGNIDRSAPRVLGEVTVVQSTCHSGSVAFMETTCSYDHHAGADVVLNDVADEVHPDSTTFFTIVDVWHLMSGSKAIERTGER